MVSPGAYELQSCNDVFCKVFRACLFGLMDLLGRICLRCSVDRVSQIYLCSCVYTFALFCGDNRSFFDKPDHHDDLSIFRNRYLRPLYDIFFGCLHSGIEADIRVLQNTGQSCHHAECYEFVRQWPFSICTVCSFFYHIVIFGMLGKGKKYSQVLQFSGR